VCNCIKGAEIATAFTLDWRSIATFTLGTSPVSSNRAALFFGVGINENLTSGTFARAVEIIYWLRAILTATLIIFKTEGLMFFTAYGISAVVEISIKM